MERAAAGKAAASRAHAVSAERAEEASGRNAGIRAQARLWQLGVRSVEAKTRSGKIMPPLLLAEWRHFFVPTGDGGETAPYGLPSFVLGYGFGYFRTVVRS